jgi:hypothetical protein
MNPFGIFSVLQALMDAIGEAFGRKSKREERKDRFWFAVLAALLLALSVLAVGMAIHQIYFEK